MKSDSVAPVIAVSDGPAGEKRVTIESVINTYNRLPRDLGTFWFFKDFNDCNFVILSGLRCSLENSNSHYYNCQKKKTQNQQ